MQDCGRVVVPSGKLHHQYQNPNSSELGFFLGRSCVLPRVVAGYCGKLWTSPAASSGLFCARFSLFRPFLSAPLMPENGPKSTRASALDQQDQRLTGGRIEWFELSIGRGSNCANRLLGQWMAGSGQKRTSAFLGVFRFKKPKFLLLLDEERWLGSLHLSKSSPLRAVHSP